MLKKYCSIFFMFTALVVLFGHGMIAHQHHDYEEQHVGQHIGHHHSDGDSHGDDEKESKDSDFGHLFSFFHHGQEGLPFVVNHNFDNTYRKQLIPFVAVLTNYHIFQRLPSIVRQNSPPDLVVYLNSRDFLPSSLRAPPAFIV